MFYDNINCMKKYISENDILMKEWDYDLNADLDPTKLTYGSNKKVWWKCSKCGNKWKTSICHRALNGSSCPKCFWQKRLSYEEKSISKTHPEIALDWNYEKNKNFTPDMFTKNSIQKVWWKCHICGKEIEKEIEHYSGCKKCKINKKLENNNLQKIHPELAKEWDYDKNIDLLPTQVAQSSNKKVWWKCSKCGYSWEAKINNRVNKRGCPCCANKVAVAGVNDLATTHPQIAKEWHPSKNKNLTPSDVTYGYGKKVWWLCPNGHEYQATVNKRTSGDGTNCPICNSGRQTSFAEQAFYFYIKKAYPDTISRYTAEFLGRMELDIYIPSIKLAIEYDGEAWHRENKVEREKKKYLACKANNIKMIRLREKMSSVEVKDIADEIFCIKDLYKHTNLEKTIKEILIHLEYNLPIDININRDRFEIQKYCQPIKNSLADKFPEISKEWHPNKNGTLKPNMVKSGSDKKVWWVCFACGNEYEASIGSRTRGTGCPICGRKKVYEALKKPVKMINPSTQEIIRIFSSILEASEELKINDSNISMVCKGHRQKAGGYAWEYLEKNEK